MLSFLHIASLRCRFFEFQRKYHCDRKHCDYDQQRCEHRDLYEFLCEQFECYECKDYAQTIVEESQGFHGFLYREVQ